MDAPIVPAPTCTSRSTTTTSRGAADEPRRSSAASAAPRRRPVARWRVTSSQAHAAAFAPLQTDVLACHRRQPEHPRRKTQPDRRHHPLRLCDVATRTALLLPGPVRSAVPAAIAPDAGDADGVARIVATRQNSRMLATPSIRTVIANAYFDGITRWLGERGWGLRLDPVSAPTTARVGRQSIAEVRLTNNGNVPLLQGHAGRDRVGEARGGVRRVAVRRGEDRRRPHVGRSRSGRLGRAANSGPPDDGGAAIWKVDAVVGGVRTSAQRVPFLQWRVTVTR